MSVLIVDGSHLAYRAKYVYFLSSPSGEDVSVTYGVLSILLSEANKLKPSSIIVCFDGGLPKYRRELVPSYKKGRHKGESKEDRENFNRQLLELRRILPLLGIVCVHKDHYEADDLMYTISRTLKEDSLVYSGDSDMLQAVSANDKVHFYNPGKKLEVGISNFKKVVGVELDQYIDYKIMLGDSSDNIEGIKGIGHKSAVSILETYGSLQKAKQASSNGHWELGKALGAKLNSTENEYMDKVRRVVKLEYDEEIKKSFQEGLETYEPYNHIRAKKALLSKAFVSLVSKARTLTELRKPELLNFDNNLVKIYVRGLK